jgi:hypothetical protein
LIGVVFYRLFAEHSQFFDCMELCGLRNYLSGTGVRRRRNQVSIHDQRGEKNAGYRWAGAGRKRTHATTIKIAGGQPGNRLRCRHRHAAGSLCDLACSKLNDSDSEAKKAVVNFARQHLSSLFHNHLKAGQQPSENLFDVLAQGSELSPAQQSEARKSAKTLAQNVATEDSGATHWSF